MKRKNWKDLSNNKIDDIIDEVITCTEHTNKTIHIGCDSKHYKEITEFVTVIVILTPGKGGRAFYLKEKVKKIESTRERLMKETWKSIDVALGLSEVLPEITKLTVHVDANPNVEYHSSNYVQEMIGMVVGQGFSVEIKPNSWAAMSVADHIVNHRNER